MTECQLKLSQLSNHLWESASILRGPVDAADFKTFVFPLFFFKRISDVFDEEIVEALEESDGDWQYALFPENHRFQIPKDCHWDDVRKKTTNFGKADEVADQSRSKKMFSQNSELFAAIAASAHGGGHGY